MPRPGRPTTERAKNFKGTLRQLIRTMSHYKLPLAAAMLFAILSTIFNIAGPKVLAKATTALATGWIAKLRGAGAIREVNLTIDGQELHIAIVNGLVSAKERIADIEAGKRFYHLVEVMTCQGGCVGGAGQPYGLTAVKRKRKQGLNDTDASALIKRAEKTPIVTTLLDKYGEERCHELLHVHYDA